MKIVSRRIYSIYAVVVFAFSFFLLTLPFFVIIAIKPWHRYTGLLNRIWARLFFTMCFIPTRVIYPASLKANQQYIYCPNHFSYLDIPTMGYTPGNYMFVGKNAMEKVPLFGYMYKKLHITVNRESLKSKHNTFVRAQQAIDDGRSLVLYPEGGVLSKQMPQMANFKNGAFKLAIAKQIPIIPVTIPYNWILLPDDDRFLFKWGRMDVVFHEPIETKGMSIDDLPMLTNKVFNVIQSELNRCNENR